MKHFLLLMLITHSMQVAAGTILSGKINGVHQAQTILVNVPFDCWYYKQLSKEIKTDNKGNFKAAISVEKAQSIFVVYNGKRILVYAEPTKIVSLIFDSTNINETLQFEGSLKAENEFRTLIGLTFFNLYPQSWNDSSSSSADIIRAIKQNQVDALKKLSHLKITSSASFKTITKADIEYFLPVKIWELVYSTRDPMKKNKQEWQNALVSSYQQYPLSNDNAISSFYYQNMVTYYARYLNATAANKEEFEKTVEKIFKESFSEVSAELKFKGKRYFEFKATNDALKDKALEHALAAFIYNGIMQGELNYLQEAYSDFLFRFPKSSYRFTTDKLMDSYFSSQAATGKNEVLLEPVDSAYGSLEAILHKHKGRAVYIDLWGSWCGPCRDEFSYNKSLKVYFSGKPVDFVYIAFEHERGDPEAIWRRTVKYYNITGRHILADSLLKNDLEKLYAPDGIAGFPEYILVDKKGVVRNLFAERPSSRELLYKQIEQLIN